MKNILFISTSVSSGGAEISLLELMRALDKSRFTCWVAAPGIQGFNSQFSDVASLELAPVRRFSRKISWQGVNNFFSGMIRSTIQLRRLIKRREIGIIYANNTHAAVYGCLLKLTTRAKLVWHIRDIPENRIVCWLLGCLSHKIVCNSAFISRQLPSFPGKKVVIYNFVSPPANTGISQSILDRAGMQQSTQGVILAQVGQMVPWKNHIDAILAIEECRRYLPDIKLFIIGSDFSGKFGAYNSLLHHIVHDRGLKGTIFFLEHIPRVDRFFGSIDILIHPAACEPFGRVIVEAMFSSKPVIAYRSGGPEEILTDGISGSLVDKNKGYKGLAGSVLELANDPAKRMALGQKAAQHCGGIFDRTVLIRKYEQLLADI